MGFLVWCIRLLTLDALALIVQHQTILFLLVASRAWVFWLNIIVLSGLLLFVALFEPAMFALPFNPLTLNVSLIALSLVALLELKKLKRLYT